MALQHICDIHTFTHIYTLMEEATMQGADLLIRSILAFSILLKDALSRKNVNIKLVLTTDLLSGI